MDGPHDPRLVVSTAPRRHTTPLSRVGRRRLHSIRRIALLACASLGLVVAAMSSGCLITDPPQFKLPTHSKPLLDQTTADPDPALVKLVQNADLTKKITFSAEVTSQEDPPGTSDFDTLHARLYIDYGTPNEFQAYRYALPTTIRTTDGKRRVSADWIPASWPVGPGCHRATLIVMHAFDDFTQCPTCPGDYSTITWQLLRCDMSEPPSCDALPISGTGSCEGWTNTCSAVRGNLMDAGVELPLCPESATEDGGQP